MRTASMTDKRAASEIRETQRTSGEYATYLHALVKRFRDTEESDLEKLENFPKYVPRGTLARFLAKTRIFEQVLSVQGSVIECGVHLGGGLMTWAQLSAIFEPANHQRRIVGFDTFAGFPSVSNEDQSPSSAPACREGGLHADSYDELLACVEAYDKARYLGHLQKVTLVKGDVAETLPAYLEKNPHTVVSLLYLDFDLFEPTALALRELLPRMPKGAVVAFDELNHPAWPGETVAVAKEVGIGSLRIQCLPFGTSISYAVLE
jgi:hypothetical protein